MRKSKLGLLLGISLTLVAGSISFSPSKKQVDDCLIDPSERGLAIASYTTNPKNEPWYGGTHRYHSTATGAVSTNYDFDQNTTVFSRINIGDTWNSNRGENVHVAVIDTGVYSSHEDFNGSNISSLSKNTYLNTSSYTDGNGHGTTSAAMIAAAVNSVGGTGVAPNVELVVLKASSDAGAFSVASINNALQYCIDNDVDIINMSLQGYASSFTATYTEDFGEYSTTVSSTGIAGSSDYSAKINACYEAGITIVAAAGNYNTNRVSYPAANDHVIAVASTGLTDANALNKAGYSNYGDWIDVCAPGYVYTPLKSGTSDYSVTLGTSFSAPIVTGAIALYKSKYPNATPDEIEEALKETCTPVNWEGGAGQINVTSFLNREPGDYVPVSGIAFNQKNYYVDKNSSGYLDEFSYSFTPSNASNKNVTFTTNDCDDNFLIDDSQWITGSEDRIVTLTVTSNDNPSISDTCNITIGEDYYKDITASDSAGLSAQLHNLMFETHTFYPTYGDCRNDNGEYYAMDPGSTSSYLTDFYTQHDISKAWSGNSNGTWNREHVWCQSHSAGLWDKIENTQKNGGSDYHHIRPIEFNLNSTRNNNAYGEVENKNSSTAKYSKTTSGSNAYLGGYLENGVWEPIDDVKGDVARILMYVYVHYATDAGGTTPSTYTNYVGNLKLNDIICEGSSVSASKALLLKWHNQDPVSNSERVRNEVAYGYQGNRNPFIDHPEYADIIFATDVVHVTSVTLNPNSLTLLPGENSILTATVLPVDANNRNVVWSTSDSGVATVSNGTVTAVAPGTATITVSSVDGNKTDTCTVTVNPRAVTSVKLNKDSLTIPCGSTDSTLSVTVNPSNATNKSVTWSVIEDNPSGCVSVNSSGKVTANAIGTATVKVTSAADSTKYATCTVTVTPVLVTSITITCAKSSLKVGDNAQVTLSTISPSNASSKTVDWISSNTDVLTVDLNGLVTAVGPGIANITAKAKDGSNVVSNAKTFTVSDVLTSIEFTNLPTNNKVSYMSGDGIFALSVTAHYQSGASLDVTNQLSPSVYVDTTRLGTQHVKATYKHDGVTKTCEADFRVTNTGSSSYTEEIEGSTTKTEINSKTFYGNGNVSIDGEIFSLTADTSTFGSTYEGRGQAIGKSGDGPATMSLTKNNQMRVTRVAVTTSGATGFKGGTLKVRVGSTYFSYISNPSGAAVAEAGDVIDTATLTTTSTEYVFEGDATGNVTAEWAQTSDVAIYIRAFEVKTETSTVNSYSGQEQAEAWANYFIDVTRGSNGPCLSSNLTTKLNGLKALWSDVKTEYLAMESDGKNAFCSTTPSFLVSECMRHYRYIVDTYGEDAQLEDFVVDGSGNAPTNVSFTNRFMRNVLDNSTIAIVVICIVGVAAIGVFAIYKKRKEN